MADEPKDNEEEQESQKGVLSSLIHYNWLRHTARNVTRIDGTNVDLVTNGDESFALCHLSAHLPYHVGDYVPWSIAMEDTASISLAVHHLNTGDGSIVPEVDGLNDKCPIRFTIEFADTEFQGGVALNNVVEQTKRDPTGAEPIPCAFLGAYRSAISIPMSIVTGLLGYPQVSGASTSADLDDVSQYPLFGRTIPSDQGNAIPPILYLRHVLGITHLTVINVNDAYGNAYVEGMRMAASVHAPDLEIHQIPLDEGPDAISTAIASVKKTGFRYIYCIVFGIETHDALLKVAYEQNVAGDGLHNWLFGDSFLGTLDNRAFERDSPLHKTYAGTGLFEASGGVKGDPVFDLYDRKMQELRNEQDLNFISGMFPKHNHPNWVGPSGVPGEGPVYHDNYLSSATSSYGPFFYEATIALGLAACSAATSENITFTGKQHFEHFKATTFSSMSGTVIFDNTTGTRDPSQALYKVTNYQVQEFTDPTTSKPMVRFEPVISDLMKNGEWNSVTDYIFNDGTNRIPIDMDPLPVNEPINLGLMIGVPLAIVFVMGVFIFLFYENKRKQNDSVWKVKPDEIKFDDPPVAIGRGSFGMVLLAEYRGTQVAVKRVIPPRKGNNSNHNSNTPKALDQIMESIGGTSSVHTSLVSSGLPDLQFEAKPEQSNSERSNNNHNTNMGMRSGSNIGFKSGTSSWMSFSVGISGVFGTKRMRMRQNDAAYYRKLKQEFMEEMRYLSKLRHPCVTTVMGAVIESGSDPMLIMEYMDHGSLYDVLHNETMFLEGDLLINILRDISQGMRFLHSAVPQVIHGDLKAANILVDTKFRAKVADFGLSQKKNLGGTGTPYWMAPELLREETSNTSATDVYSFGIILYEVFSRRDPYEGENAQEVLKAVMDPHIRKRPQAPRHMPEKIKSLMTDCVEECPDNRPSFEELDIRIKRMDAETVDQNQANRNAQVSLFDIFPRHIAEALRDGRSVEAEHKDCVTIFFSDIVGFTNISSQLEPRKVANMLDRLYHKFDELSHKHDIFKVETIGDAYMAVTNLVKDQETDHAKRIVDFSIEAVQAANGTYIDEDDPERGVVNIRVGFHSGPVVADVVGNRNPRYCLFGDTVNTASRMESNSEVNRIHCSHAAAKILKTQCPDIKLKSRGSIKIKGKGHMRTYWVNEKEEMPGITDFLATADEDALLNWVSKTPKAGANGMEAIIERSSEFLESSEFLPPPTRTTSTGQKKENTIPTIVENEIHAGPLTIDGCCDGEEEKGVSSELNIDV